jgi:hypothetical protein
MGARIAAVAAALLFSCGSLVAQARGGGGYSGGHSSYGSTGGHSSAFRSSSGPGTGSKSESVTVHGYTKKNGTYVAPSHRTTPDKNFKNNYSTKGNVNPYTGKAGTRIEPPKKH